MRSLARDLVCLLAAVSVSLPGVAQARPDDTEVTALLRATLTVDKPRVGANEPATVRFTLQNLSQQPLSILEWETPLEGVKNDIFAIEHDGHAVAYRGPLFTRGLPAPESYVRLAPRESVTAVVDLARFYAIDEPGTYRVRLRGRVSDLGTEDAAVLAASAQTARRLRPRPLGSNEVSFEQTGRRTAPPEPPPPSRRTAIAAAPVFQGSCNAADKAAVETALDKSRIEASLAAIGLAFLPTAQRPLSQRTTKWFGSYDLARYELVVRNYVAIYNGLASRQITFICEDAGAHCGADIAFVSHLDPFRIHLCPAFFRLRDDGPDSKPGAILHEMSHFQVIAGTEDHCRYMLACADLAVASPGLAVDSAQNYAYFAENDPYIPLRTDE